jgi:hypothetical protein
MHEGDFVPAEPIFLERIAVPERVTAPLVAIALGRNAQAQGGVGDDVEPRDSRVRGAPHVVAEPTAPRALRARRLRRPYRNEVPQHHNRDSLSSRVGCGPSVLSGQHGCGCVKFGTKRRRTLPLPLVFVPLVFCRNPHCRIRLYEVKATPFGARSEGGACAPSSHPNTARLYITSKHNSIAIWTDVLDLGTAGSCPPNGVGLRGVTVISRPSDHEATHSCSGVSRSCFLGEQIRSFRL